MVKAKQTRRDAFESLAVEYLRLADRTPRDSDSPGTRLRTGGVNRTLGSRCGVMNALIESWVSTSRRRSSTPTDLSRRYRAYDSPASTGNRPDPGRYPRAVPDP